MSTRVIPNTAPAQRCGTAYASSKLTVQVLSPIGVFIRLGHSRDELDNPLPFQGPQGKTFDSTAGVVEFQWLGEVWCEGVPGNASLPIIDLEVVPL